MTSRRRWSAGVRALMQLESGLGDLRSQSIVAIELSIGAAS